MRSQPIMDRAWSRSPWGYNDPTVWQWVEWTQLTEEEARTAARLAKHGEGHWRRPRDNYEGDTD